MTPSPFRKVLVGYTATEGGREALALGGALARAAEAPLDVATVAAGEDLARTAIERGADLLVLGSTHRGPIGRVLPGATAVHLLGEAPCAVAVAPSGFGTARAEAAGWLPTEGADAGLRVIGVGYDGSAAAGEALSLATELALRNGAALRVYTVARPFRAVAGTEDALPSPGTRSEAAELQATLHDAVADQPPEVRALPVFLRGIPAVELLRASENGVDLLVLGSRRGGPLRRAMHGSVSSAVMFEARCPVLVVPSGVVANAAAALATA